MAQLTYKDAGVDLELYEQAMQKLPRLLRRTQTPRVIDLPGGFAGLFRLDYNSRLFARNYRDPVLVSGTDGVGTKIKVAELAGVYDTIGLPDVLKGAGSKLELYALYLDKQAATFAEGSGSEERYTVGGRFFTNPKPWDVDIEAAAHACGVASDFGSGQCDVACPRSVLV